MENQYDLPLPLRETRRASWFEFALVAGFFLSLLIGIVSLGAFWLVYSTADAELSASQISALPTEQILPQLALQELTGDPAAALAAQALAAGELATAHAALLFDTRAFGSERAGLVLQLARRYQARSQSYQAAMVYKMAAALAILDPALAPIERNKILVQTAAGLLKADEPAAALLFAQQASLFAQQIPTLLPAQRNEIFSNLLPVAKQLDDPHFAQQVAELARNPYLQPGGITFTPQLHGAGRALPASPEVENATAARVLNARRLIERIAFTGGADIEPEVRNLAAALIEENRLRRINFEQRTVAAPNLPERYWMLGEHRAWLVQQLRIASLGYGLSIIPEWESEATALMRELATVTANLDVAIDQLAEEQLAPRDKTLIRVEGLTWLALQHELGLYPYAPVDSLHQRARVVNDTLIQFDEPLALPFGYDRAETLPGFRVLNVQSVQ